MSSVDSADRDPLEVLADEFTQRRRRGERPSISEYEARYPELAAKIKDLFPTIVAIEDLKVLSESSHKEYKPLEAIQVERLGDFRILGEIGRGGMGIVYEAFQESLGRHVAVKVLPRQSLLAPRQLERFQREAQTAARLHHTNIVPLFGVGEQDGYHYLVMQRIQGVGLDAVLASLQRLSRATSSPCDTAAGVELSDEGTRLARLLVAGRFLQAAQAGSDRGVSPSRGDGSASAPSGSGTGPDPNAPSSSAGSASAGKPESAEPNLGPPYWRSVAAIGMQVAEALDYAHLQRTLHRDIKPANLLLDSQGLVWISDFGLAKAMDVGEERVTQTGALVGTLRYMPPEQFRGEFDTRSDLYSLGLTLYELLVLQPAFQGTDRSQLMRQITEERPPRPRKLNPRIPRDLETIVLKAMAREPADRYPSGAELSRDLERFLADRPIAARRSSWAEQFWRWARRNTALTCLAATTFALLIAVALVAGAGYLRTARASAEEAKQRKKAEETSALALEALDNIFRQFAPDRTAPLSSLVVLGDGGEQIRVPIQPVLSKEAAALLEQMLAFYDRLAAQGSDDARLRRRIAEANRRVGDIRQRLGHFEPSLMAYNRAVELYDHLAGSAADDGQISTEIGRIYNELGNLHATANRLDAAYDFYRKALAALEADGTSASATPHRYELARAYYFLGKRAGWRPGPAPLAPGGRRRRAQRGPEQRSAPGDPHRPADSAATGADGPSTKPSSWDPWDEEEQALQRAVLSAWWRAKADSPLWPPLRPDRPGADAARKGGKPPAAGRPGLGGNPFEESMNNLRKAADLLERLVAEHPTVPDYQHLLARCYREMPSFSAPGESQDNTGRATRILQKLVEAYPAVPDYRYDLSEIYALQDLPPPFAPVEEEARRRALQSLTKALAISEELVAEHPNIPDYAVSQVYIRSRLADILWDQDPSPTETHLRKALDLQSLLARRFPQNSSYRFGTAMIHESLAGFLQDQGRLAEARSELEKTINLFRAVLQSDPQAGFLRGALALNYATLADVLRATGQSEAAEEAARKARDPD